ncbi:MAG: glycosyltransferase [Muribaculaceae bacterium]
MNTYKNCRITVLMGIYNCASTLPDALNSLLEQTYQGFKVVMCDDGSTDNTFVVAQYYAKNYPDKFILIKNKKNIKLGATLNRCLEYADTEYIARMDADDLSLPHRFEKEIEYLDSHRNVDVVFSKIQLFDENGVYFIPNKSKDICPTPKQILTSSPFAHGTCMARTEVFKSVNGYDARIIRIEDYDLWFRLYEKGCILCVIGEPLYQFRENKGAAARRTFKSSLTACRVLYKGASQLGLSPIWKLYSIKCLILGIMPVWLYRLLHKHCK